MMNKKTIVALVALIFGMGVIFASCAGMQAKGTAGALKDPLITLESFEVPQYDGYWYYSGKTKTTKGKAGDHGAPLPMSFLFNIQNPNPYPVLLEGIKFTVAFEDFDLITVNNGDSYWIPGGKTDQVRLNTLITVRSGLLSLLVTGGYKLKAKNMNAWQALEKFWTGASDYTLPVTVKEGAFVFKANGAVKVMPFGASFP